MTTILTIVLSVVLSAQMDSTQLWIGDQTGLHLEATASELRQNLTGRSGEGESGSVNFALRA